MDEEIDCPESTIDPKDEIEDVAEPLDDSVDEEIDFQSLLLIQGRHLL